MAKHRTNQKNLHADFGLTDDQRRWAQSFFQILIRSLERISKDEQEVHDAVFDALTYAAQMSPASVDDFRRLTSDKARKILLDNARKRKRHKRILGTLPKPDEAPHPGLGVNVWQMTEKMPDLPARLLWFSAYWNKDDPAMLSFDELSTVIHRLYAEEVLQAIERLKSALVSPEQLTDEAAVLANSVNSVVNRRGTPGAILRSLAELLWFERPPVQRPRAETAADWGRVIGAPEPPTVGAADRWNDIAVPLLTGLSGTEQAPLERLQFLRDGHVPLVETNSADSELMGLVRSMLAKPKLEPEQLFNTLRANGWQILQNLKAVENWVEHQLQDVALRFKPRRRAEFSAGLAVASENDETWNSFKWYDPVRFGKTMPAKSVSVGRMVTEVTCAVWALPEHAESAQNLGLFLGADVVELPEGASADTALQHAQEIGADILIGVLPATEPANAPSAVASFGVRSSYRVQLIDVHNGGLLWETPQNLIAGSVGTEYGGHYQKVRKRCLKAAADLGELCVRAGIVPDLTVERKVKHVKPKLGFLPTLPAQTLATLLKSGGTSLEPLQRKAVVARLVHLLVSPAELHDHTAALIRAFAPEIPGSPTLFPSLATLDDTTAEKVISGALLSITALQDRKLIELICNPVALYNLLYQIDLELPCAWDPYITQYSL